MALQSAAAYIRFSAEDQAEYSPGAQLRTIRRAAKNSGELARRFIEKIVWDKTARAPENHLLYPLIYQTVYGGPDGELGASLRYLSQRFSMPYAEVKAILTDIGTEELAHLEMVGSIVHQLTRNLSEEEIKKGGFADYFVDHTVGVYPNSASGVPYTASSMASKGDPITDIIEDMAAEQKARTTYDNILRFADDPDVRDPIKFLRQREIVHFQRFGEALRIIQDQLDAKNFYAFNPAFDKMGK